VDTMREDEITDTYMHTLSVKAANAQVAIGSLSGGNQQKVIISSWLATLPKVLILDEPTRGIDVGAKSEIYAIMNELVKQGVSIIMVSSELPEVLNMSDRIVVMCDGTITAIIDHNETNQEKIMQYAVKK
jgi:ABC-type sugar transport system ATPase subunit